ELRAGVDKDGAYHYARGQRYELLSNTPGIVEPFAPFLVIGLVISGLESRSVPYHPQEVLAVTEVVCLEDSSSWQLGPLHEAIVRGMTTRHSRETWCWCAPDCWPGSPTRSAPRPTRWRRATAPP